LDEREKALSDYANRPDDEKKEYKRTFTNYVVDNMVKDDPQFANLWARYFSSEWQTIEMKVEEDAS
jgi:hypothetical protein